MYLMYYMNEKGERVYTLKVRPATRGPPHIPCSCRSHHAPLLPPAAAALPPSAPAAAALTCIRVPAPPARAQKAAPDGTPTQSAHPARFSPDDKFSRERTTCKKRFGLLPTQLPAHNY